MIFMSGVIEVINLVIKGVFEMYYCKGKYIIIVMIEYKVVLDICYVLEKRGGEVMYFLVDQQGLIDLEELEVVIRLDIILVVVMWVNNEMGVI